MNNFSIVSLQHYFNSLPEYKCPICGGKDFTIFSSFGFEVDKFVPLSFKRYIENDMMVAKLTYDINDTVGSYLQTRCNTCGFLCTHDYDFLKNKLNENPKIENIHSNLMLRK